MQRTLDEFRSTLHRANTAGREFPDARVRLDHVLELAEEAAHKTLDLVERSGPLVTRMASDAAALIEPIRSAKQVYGNGGVAELLSRVEAYLSNARSDGDAVPENLNDVLMTQSYQDLSGQIIRTVIKIMVELELRLAHFSELAGESPMGAPLAKKAETDSHGYGPAVPGVTTDAVGEQEGVDALLARMGM